MTDTAKIVADARKIAELVVSQSEALTAYVTAAHAAADGILALAGDIEAEAGGGEEPGPGPGDPVLFSVDVPLTEPYHFDAAELLGARTWLAKVIFPRATPTGYAKCFGAEFSGEPKRAGMVLGHAAQRRNRSGGNGGGIAVRPGYRAD